MKNVLRRSIVGLILTGLVGSSGIATFAQAPKGNKVASNTKAAGPK